MEVITSSLLRKFSENLHEQNKTIATVPAEQSPRKLIDTLITSFTRISEVQLLIDLDVVRPIASTHPATASRSGVGPYECLICAHEKRYYRYTRKINFQEHFDKHSIGKKF